MLVENLGGRAFILEKVTYSSLLFLAVSGNGALANSIRQLKDYTTPVQPIEVSITFIFLGAALIVFAIAFGIYSFKEDIKHCMGKCANQDQEGPTVPLLSNVVEAK